MRPASARRFAAAEVVEREGCRVELVRDGEAYRGGTVGKSCTSALASTSYATSEVTIHRAADRVVGSRLHGR